MNFKDLIEAILKETNKSVGRIRGGIPEIPSELSQKGYANPSVKKSADHGFKIIKGNYRKALSDLVTDYQENRLVLRKFRENAEKLMRSYFEKAYRYGMMIQAGISSTPKDFQLKQSQYQWIAKAAAEEYKYFESLINDIRTGNQKVHFLSRVDRYVDTLNSIKDAGIVAGTPVEGYVIFRWEVDYDAEHCPGCLYLAEHSPFTRENIPCLVGETKIHTLAGEFTIEELYRGKYPYEHMFVWSIDGDMILPSLVKAVVCNGEEETLIVTLDNEEKIECTPDHLFILKNGKVRKSSELSVGDSLMRFDTVIDRDGYRKILSKKTNRWFRAHWLVARYFGLFDGVKFDGQRPVIHHILSDQKSNNDPMNLLAMGNVDHNKLHGDHFVKNLRNWETENPNDLFELRRNNANRFRDLWSKFDNRITNNQKLNAKKRAEWARNNRHLFSEKAKQAFVNNPGLRNISRESGKRNFKHIEKFIKYISDDKKKEILKLRMEGNSYNEISKIVGVSIGGAWKVCKNNLSNHKVVSVKKSTKKIVYDLITDAGNFALSSGIFIHNCTPRDGATQCLYNCKCGLTVQKVDKKTYDSIVRSSISKKSMLSHLNRMKQASLGTRRR